MSRCRLRARGIRSEETDHRQPVMKRLAFAAGWRCLRRGTISCRPTSRVRRRWNGRWTGDDKSTTIVEAERPLRTFRALRKETEAERFLRGVRLPGGIKDWATT